MFQQKDIDRFWEKVRIKGPDECWEWIASKFEKGYGKFNWKNKNYKAHKFAFMITNNIILQGMDIIIRHKCNNPPCCNPNHLLEGTQKENVEDSIKAGTHRSINQSGILNNNANASLIEEDIKRIRQLGQHFTPTEIWNMPEWKNKIAKCTINRIINYKIWRHVK